MRQDLDYIVITLVINLSVDFINVITGKIWTVNYDGEYPQLLNRGSKFSITFYRDENDNWTWYVYDTETDDIHKSFSVDVFPTWAGENL